MSVTSTMTESLRMVRNQENFCSIGWELGVCCLVSGPVAGFAGAGIPDTISCAALIDKVFLLLFVHKKKILLLFKYLTKLTILVTSAIDAPDDRSGVMGRLAFYAGADAWHRAAAALGDRLAAVHAVCFALTCRHSGARDLDRIGDGVVDLILNRSVGCPTICHSRAPQSWFRVLNHFWRYGVSCVAAVYLPAAKAT